MKPDKELYCRPSAAPVRTLAPASEIVRAVTLLRSAKKPLIIIGKGLVCSSCWRLHWLSCAHSRCLASFVSAQYSRAEDPLSLLLERLPVPFLPTPMGKGLVTDAHPLCIAAARSTALAEADVVMVIGARLNWILHYGKSPKWRKDVKLIRIDISSETIDDNSRADVPLVGDAYAILTQMCEEVIRAGGNQELTMSKDQTAWYKLLMAKCHDNSQKLIEKTMLFPTRKASAAVPPLLTYQQAFDIIRKSIPKDHIFIGEGANTMDIARSMFEVQQPRSRLDAGTQATMGVGLGYCIAAAIYEQKKPADRRPVVAVLGDSAFGFSAMEIETAVRNKLGMLIIVMNNGGVRIIHDHTARSVSDMPFGGSTGI
jgi:2-hydroxyacyl-CoA lyase 1